MIINLEDFLELIYDKQICTDQKIDIILDQFNELAWNGRFEEIDQIYISIDLNKIDSYIAIALISSGLSYKTKLETYNSFVERIRKWLSTQNKTEQQITNILKGF